MAHFLDGRTHTTNQINFIETVIDNLTRTGVVEPSRLYEPPYIRFSARGVEGAFPEPEVDLLISALDQVKQRAVA